MTKHDDKKNGNVEEEVLRATGDPDGDPDLPVLSLVDSYVVSTLVGLRAHRPGQDV